MSPPPHPPATRSTLLCALGLYGGGYFVWQIPVLVDHAISVSLHETHAEVMSSRSAIFFAWAIGATVLGGRADIVGRRPVALGSAIAVVLHLVGCALCQTAAQLVACRLVGGFALGGLAYGFTLAIESAEADQKSLTALRLNSWHTINAGIVVAIHHACQTTGVSWRTELCCDATVLGTFVAAAAWHVPESVDFLSRARRKGRLPEAIDSTVVCPAAEASPVGAGSPPTTVRTILLTLLCPTYRRATLTLSICFVAVSFVFYILTFEADALSPHLELNVLLLAGLETPGHAARRMLGCNGP